MSDTTATAGPSFAIARRAEAPRANSCATTATTNAANANMRIDGQLCVTAAATRTTQTATAAAIGQMKLRRTVLSVVRRHAATGPIPESRTSISASGTMYWL